MIKKCSDTSRSIFLFHDNKKEFTVSANRFLFLFRLIKSLKAFDVRKQFDLFS